MRIRRRLVALVVGAAVLGTSAPASALQVVPAERRPPGACIVIGNLALCY